MWSFEGAVVVITGVGVLWLLGWGLSAPFWPLATTAALMLCVLCARAYQLHRYGI